MKNQLHNFDLETLSLFERAKYNGCVSCFPKAEILQMIIDTSKFEDLSEGLQQILLEQRENY